MVDESSLWLALSSEIGSACMLQESEMRANVSTVLKEIDLSEFRTARLTYFPVRNLSKMGKLSLSYF